MESWSDRDWSQWAMQKAIQADSRVGTFDDQLRSIKMENRMLKGDNERLTSRVQLLEEQLNAVVDYVAAEFAKFAPIIAILSEGDSSSEG